MTGDYLDPDPIRIAEAIQAVVYYLWDDEYASYVGADAGQRQRHILRDVAVLQAWLSKHKKLLDFSHHTMAPQCLRFRRRKPKWVFDSDLQRLQTAFARLQLDRDLRDRTTLYASTSRGFSDGAQQGR